MTPSERDNWSLKFALGGALCAPSGPVGGAADDPGGGDDGAQGVEVGADGRT